MSCPEAGEEASRRDAFLRGRFFLHQPVGVGYRSGLDALLLAASVSPEASGRAVDLGSGAGAVAFAAAARAARLEVTLAENDPLMCRLAARGLMDPANAALAERLRLAPLDCLAARPTREAAGLPDGAFAHVLTNPPFYPATGRASPDATRRAAVTLSAPDMLARWLRVAAALLAPRGRLHAILRPADLPLAAAALENRLGAVTVLPVHTGAGEPASRILLGARKGSRGAFRILPGVSLFEPNGGPSALSEAISAGTAWLDLLAE